MLLESEIHYYFSVHELTNPKRQVAGGDTVIPLKPKRISKASHKSISLHIAAKRKRKKPGWVVRLIPTSSSDRGKVNSGED